MYQNKTIPTTKKCKTLGASFLHMQEYQPNVALKGVGLGTRVVREIQQNVGERCNK